MVANALLITIAILLAIGFWLMDELKFFIPYKGFLVDTYLAPISCYAFALFLNVFAGCYVLIRKFFLKDTGRKLLHLDKQLHLGESPMPAPWLDEDPD